MAPNPAPVSPLAAAPSADPSLGRFPEVCRAFYGTAGFASFLGGAATLFATTLTPASLPVGLLWMLFGSLSCLLWRSPGCWTSRGVFLLSLLMVAGVLGAATLQGWGIEGAGLPFLLIPMMGVSILCARREQALLLVGCLVVLGWAALAGGEPLHQIDEHHPSPAVRLLGLGVALVMVAALGDRIGRSLNHHLKRLDDAFLRYRNLFNQVPTGLVLHRDGQVLDVNDAMVALMQAEGRRTLQATTLPDWFSGDSRAPALQSIGTVLAQPRRPAVSTDVLNLVTMQGQQVPVRLVSARSTLDDQRSVITFLIDERQNQALQRDLISARDAAEAASRTKSAFVANTSHEIRTPLNGIIGLAGMAQEPGLDPEVRQRYLRLISENAKGLASLLSDVLDLAKIESGRLDITASPFDLVGLLHGVQEGHALLAEAKGLSFVYVCVDDLPPRLMGDALRIRQVLNNLLSNALKFTRAGMVRLTVSRDARGLTRFEVEDTGPGMGPLAMSRLFQRFSQLDESTSRAYGGTGLGLAICKDLVELMHGQIGVHAEPGRGSRFWFELELPVSGPTHEADTAAPPPVPQAQASTGLHVLVVEDNEVNLLVTCHMLKRAGFEVTTADNGLRAITAVSRLRAQGRVFDAVLMDVQMPEMDGLQATEELRVMQPPYTGPVIALTAGITEQERHRAIRAGMDELLPKPVDAEQLVQVLRRLVRQRRVDTEL